MSVILRILRLGLGLGAVGVSGLSVLAFFGFASPILDLLNHLQVLLLIGTLLSLLVVPALMGPGLLRPSLLAVTATGFLFSALTVVPETVAALAQRPPVSPERPVVRMVTHNLFGLNFDMQRVRDVLRAADPDIIALQEYFVEQREELHGLLAPDYPYFVLCAGGRRANNAIYSRLPFTSPPGDECDEDAETDNRLTRILAQFTLVDGTSFSVITTHLDWPVPLWRQSGELQDLEQFITEIDGPLVLVGDMNTTPWSYALRFFSLRAGLERQTHNLLSYPLRFYLFGRWRDTLPFLALDHVLSRGLEVHELHGLPPTGSDHLPVFFTFSVPAAD